MYVVSSFTLLFDHNNNIITTTTSTTFYNRHCHHHHTISGSSVFLKRLNHHVQYEWNQKYKSKNNDDNDYDYYNNNNDDDDDDDDNFISLWDIIEYDDNGDDDNDNNNNDNNDDSNQVETKHNHNKNSNINPTTTTTIKKPSRGVGRQGYNTTIMKLINYDTTLYNSYYIKESYNIRLNLLMNYYNVHGDINVPFRYNVTVDDYDDNGNVCGVYDIHLGRWLHWIRNLYRKDQEKEIEYYKNKKKNKEKNDGNHNTNTNSLKRRIPLEYVEKLTLMGMNWEGVGARRRPTEFRKKCNELKQFIEEYGHSYVPKDWPENKSLAMWVERQRYLYRRKMEGNDQGDRLTDDRIHTLQSLGFDFTRSKTKVINQHDNNTSTELTVYDKYNDLWWESLEMYLQNKSLFIDQNEKDKENDNRSNTALAYLSYWIMEQKRQYMILQDELEYITPRNSVTMKIPFTCSLSPQRFEALTEIGFDFSVKQNNFLLALSPWRDIVDYKFDHHKMLDLFRSRKESTGSSNVSLDQNLIISLILSQGEYNNLDYFDDSILLYLFQQRIKWENRHQSIRSKYSTIDWILEKEDLNVEEELNKIGFCWYENDLPDNNEVWSREYEWWGHYYDLCRYKKSNDDFALDPFGHWYSEELVDWLEEQKQSYEHYIGEADHDKDGNGGFESINRLEEWHFQALYDIGFDFKPVEDAYFIQSTFVNGPKPIGRPPVILSLENHDLNDDYDNLADDLKEIMNTSMNRKPIDKAEQLAWLVRYEALRRLYSLYGSGSLSTLSTDKDVGDQRLALWAINQRKQYSNYLEGKKSALTPKRIQLLEDINFDWEIKTKEGEHEEMIKALKRFKDQHGHCFVPAVYSKDIKLGQWVHIQRQLYKLSQQEGQPEVKLDSELSPQHANELMQIGLDLTMDNLSFGNIAYETVRISINIFFDNVIRFILIPFLFFVIIIIIIIYDRYGNANLKTWKHLSYKMDIVMSHLITQVNITI